MTICRKLGSSKTYLPTMRATFWVAVIHVVTRQAEDLVWAQPTFDDSGGSTAEVANLGSRCCCRQWAILNFLCSCRRIDLSVDRRRSDLLVIRLVHVSFTHGLGNLKNTFSIKWHILKQSLQLIYTAFRISRTISTSSTHQLILQPSRL